MKADRERLIDLCSDLLEGIKGIIETSREMCRWRLWIGPEDDVDFATCGGIGSETDHLPLGSSRENWQDEAIEKEDDDI